MLKRLVILVTALALAAIAQTLPAGVTKGASMAGITEYGYPNGLRADQISDIVRLTSIVDIYAALVEKRAYRLAFTHTEAFATMERMGGKLDYHLLHAFRPVALGTY